MAMSNLALKHSTLKLNYAE